MNHRQHRSPLQVATLFFGISMMSLYADRLHLLDGKILEGDVAYVSKNSLSWRLPEVTTGMNVAFKRISYLEMDPSKEWEEAMAAMEGGQYEEAVKMFTTLAEDRGRKSAYPAPGNSASRARYYLVECMRRTGDAKGIQKTLSKLKPELLLPWEREIDPALAAWGALQRREVDRVLTLLPLDPETDASRGSGAERHYLRGAALKRLGRSEEALAELTLAYAFSYSDGADTVSARALQEAAELLAGLPGAREELRAILHLYASRHGDGALWPSADAAFTKLLFEPLDTISPAGELEAPAAGDEPQDGQTLELVGAAADLGEVLLVDDFKAGVKGKQAGRTEGSGAEFLSVGEAYVFDSPGRESYQLSAADVDSPAVFEAGATYRLVLEVRSSVENGAYRIALVSGDIFGTAETGKAPAANVPWEEVTLLWSVPSAHHLIGEPLGFRISGDGSGVRFRSVRLIKDD